MTNQEIFKPDDVVKFHKGSPTVRVIKISQDIYLFSGEIIEDVDAENIGKIKRNFYLHKFFKV